MLRFGGHVKLTKHFCTQLIIWVDIILDHIDIGMILPRYEGSCIVYRSKWYQNKTCEILIIDNLPKWYG